MPAGNNLTDGLSWPSISFAILVASLLLSSYILWRRYQSRSMLMRRVAELEALSAAGRAIVASELDITALCALIAQEAGQVIDNRTFQIGLFDDHQYQILFWTINGRSQETPQTFDLSENSGVVGWVQDTRRPLLVRDFRREMDSLPARPRYISDTPPRSAVFIPLISGEEVIGILAAQSDQPNRFDEEDMRRLMILANQSAAAIAHARLFEQEKKRAAHLALVGQIARQVDVIQDLEEILRQVVRLIRDTFGFHPVSIFAIDSHAGDAVLQASTVDALSTGEHRLSQGQGIVGAAADRAETITSNSVSEDERFVARLAPAIATDVSPVRSEMALPLIVSGEVLGVLDVQSQQVGAFTPVEQTALEALAAEVAIAIDKAQQLAFQREQAWVTNAQLQVAEAIGQQESVEAIVDTVARLTVMLVGVSFCGILLWDEETAVYNNGILHGADAETAAAFSRLRLASGDWGALDAVHVGQETLTTATRPPWMSRRAARRKKLPATTLIPIRYWEQILGVMAVSELKPDAKAALLRETSPVYRRQELLQNIVRQTAQALESSYLRQAQQEEAWVNTALLQVAEAVNNLFDLNEILDTIVRLVPMLVGVDTAVILVWDDEQKAFRGGPSYGLSRMGEGLLADGEIPHDEFLSVRTQTANSPTPASAYYTVQLPPWMARAMNTDSTHAFPLHARGNLVGIMLVGNNGQDNRRSFSLRRLNILTGIAHQAATAVVNNHLYKEAAERNRLEQELEVARGIQASLIPPGSPAIPGCGVASMWQAARQVSGDFYDFLPLNNGCWGVVIADVADKGVPAALFMAISRTILRTVAFNRTDPAETLIRTNEIIGRESESDLFVTVFYAIWNPKTNRLTFANGGHNPPMLLRGDGQVALLHGDGMALGVLPSIAVESKSIRLQPGDTLIFYTDGVTEAMNEDYDEFGMERLRLTAVTHQQKPAPALMEAITDSIHDHAGGTPQFDDITLIIMKREDD